MYAKQKKIRVFEILLKDEGDFFAYVEKNLVLLKEYLLLIKGDYVESVEKFLDMNGLCYLFIGECNLKNSTELMKPQSVSESGNSIVNTSKLDIGEVKKGSLPTKIIDKPLRSGTIFEYEGDIVMFARVNSGAKIICESNVQLFDKIDGIVESNGDFMILKSIDKGSVVFNGDILEQNDFNGVIKRVVKTDSGYRVEEL
jgi:septum site-determining protein MinC